MVSKWGVRHWFVGFEESCGNEEDTQKVAPLCMRIPALFEVLMKSKNVLEKYIATSLEIDEKYIDTHRPILKTALRS
jgi:hypothetical protein